MSLAINFCTDKYNFERDNQIGNLQKISVVVYNHYIIKVNI